MLAFIKKLWTFVKKVAEKAWSLFQKEVKQKKKDLMNITAKDFLKSSGKEVESFFVGGAKSLATHVLHKKAPQLGKVCSFLNVPYENCFRDGTISLYNCFTNYVPNVWKRMTANDSVVA